MSRSAVFLDRDGVINRAVVRNGLPETPASRAHLRILPGVPQALRALRARGFALVVVTNQPDVARGKISRHRVEDIHQTLQTRLCFDAILTCFHDDSDHCTCRKPEPGLLLRAARELNLDLKSSFMIGDRWRDMEAGQRAGCRTLYVDANYGERAPVAYDFRVRSLGEAAHLMLRLAEEQ
jgi:D-glycero-D-manno-heptose 1,7-bisphosphate phosphatase